MTLNIKKPLPSELVEFFKENYTKDNFAEIFPSAVRFGARGYKSRMQCDIHPRQHPDEFINLLKFMEGKNIQKYMEIGIEFGGTFMLVDAFLRYSNPEFKKSVGIDLRLDLNAANEQVVLDTPRRGKRYLDLDLKAVRSFQEYSGKYPTCEFVWSHSDDYQIDEKFDFIFIDSNGKYKQLMKTFNQFKDYAKYIAFHDTRDTRYGTKEVFEELAKQYESIDISVEVVSPGIGIIIL